MYPSMVVWGLLNRVYDAQALNPASTPPCFAFMHGPFVISTILAIITRKKQMQQLELHVDEAQPLPRKRSTHKHTHSAVHPEPYAPEL